MRFATPLVPATLTRRYKRFLADAVLDTGEEVVAHCPNSGAMLGLNEPGRRIWLEPNDDPKKKLNYGWRLVDLGDGHMAGIDTGVPNRIVGEALRAGRVPTLDGYAEVRAEVKYGTNSRVDFLLRGPDRPDTYVEVKNVHLRRTGTLAEFPDCVTTRGAKHQRELAAMVAQGHRAVTLYVLQRTDCDGFALAADLDPGYAEAAAQARTAGVEALCMGTKITTEEIVIGPRIPIGGG